MYRIKELCEKAIRKAKFELKLMRRACNIFVQPSCSRRGLPRGSKSSKLSSDAAGRWRHAARGRNQWVRVRQRTRHVVRRRLPWRRRGSPPRCLVTWPRTNSGERSECAGVGITRPAPYNKHIYGHVTTTYEYKDMQRYVSLDTGRWITRSQIYPCNISIPLTATSVLTTGNPYL